MISRQKFTYRGSNERMMEIWGSSQLVAKLYNLLEDELKEYRLQERWFHDEMTFPQYYINSMRQANIDPKKLSIEYDDKEWNFDKILDAIFKQLNGENVQNHRKPNSFIFKLMAEIDKEIFPYNEIRFPNSWKTCIDIKQVFREQLTQYNEHPLLVHVKPNTKEFKDIKKRFNKGKTANCDILSLQRIENKALYSLYY